MHGFKHCVVFILFIPEQFLIMILATMSPLLMKLLMKVQVKIHNLKKIQIQPVSVLHLQLKNSLNIVLDLQKATISMIQSIYVAWLKVNHPEEDSSHFMSLSKYFPDAVTHT